jgi:hypothetical protein
MIYEHGCVGSLLTYNKVNCSHANVFSRNDEISNGDPLKERAHISEWNDCPWPTVRRELNSLLDTSAHVGTLTQ